MIPVAATLPAAASDWTTIPVGTSADLHCLLGGGYLSGSDGFIARSTDNGLTWTTMDFATSATLYSVVSQSASQVWAGAGAGTIRLKLSDSLYTARSIPDASQDFVLFSSASGQMHAVGTQGSIYFTGNWGVTWTLRSSGTTVSLNAGMNSYGLVVGDQGTILRTTDGGVTWTPQASGTSADLHAVLNPVSGVQLAAGEGGTILRSTNGGITWIQVDSHTTATIRDMKSSGQNGYWVIAVGDWGTVLRSTDAGLTWCSLDSGTLTHLYCVSAINNNIYLVGGANGLLRRTVNGGGLCLETATGVEPGAFAVASRLTGPHPSPVVDRARFSFEPGTSGETETELLDVTGRRVAVLQRGRVTAGQPVTVRLETSGYGPGVYFLRIRGAGLDETKRFVIAR